MAKSHTAFVAAFLGALLFAGSASSATLRADIPVAGVRVPVVARHADGSEVYEAAAFIASLPHGPELAKVHLYLGDAAEIDQRCGEKVEGCYDSEIDTIYGPVEATNEYGVARGEVLAHEYGHHLVNSRPGDAYGTPRWDLLERVCPQMQAGELFSEAIHYPRYVANPEEAFAETYASMTFPSIAEHWRFTPLLAPSSDAYTAIRQDITHPWPLPYAMKRLRASCGSGRDIY